MGNDTFDFSDGGNNSVTGGAGADDITCGGGTDTLVYAAGSDSTSTGHDTIHGFNADADKFDLTVAVTNVTSDSGSLSTATFDTDMGNAINDWVGATVMTATGGDLSGEVFLVVDMNANNSYDAGTDLVVDITGYSGTIDTGDFI